MAETPTKNEKADQTSGALSFEDFAPDGDVVFIVKNDTRVRVRSAFMMAASPVFAVMLGPNFKEGRALAKASVSPVEISLPEDDPEPFGWICRALHCQAGTMLWKPNTVQLASAWLLIDKYDMKDSMQLSLAFWLNEKVNYPVITIDDLWLLAQISCASQDTGSFTVVTRKLILRTTTSFSCIASAMESRTKPIIPECLVYKLTAMLQEARDSAKTRSAQLLYIDLPKTLLQCNSATTAYLKYLDQASKAPSVIPDFLDPTAPLQRASSLIPTIINWAGKTRCGCQWCPNNKDLLRVKVSNFLKLEVDKGLCLSCLDGPKCPIHKK